MEKKGLILIAIIALFYWLTRTDSSTDEATGLVLKYHIEYPQGGSSGDNLPTIIALHGNGDTYDNFYNFTLKDLKIPARVILIEAPNKYWPYGKSQLEQYSTAIANFSAQMQNKFSSYNKPMLLGFSGGAVMAYYSAFNHCQSYSVIVPISGMLKSNMLPDTINMDDTCKVLAFHGTKDSVLSFSSGEYAIKQLKKYSNNVKLTSFDAGHHGIAQEFKGMILGKVGNNL